MKGLGSLQQLVGRAGFRGIKKQPAASNGGGGGRAPGEPPSEGPPPSGSPAGGAGGNAAGIASTAEEAIVVHDSSGDEQESGAAARCPICRLRLAADDNAAVNAHIGAPGLWGAAVLVMRGCRGLAGQAKPLAPGLVIEQVGAARAERL